MKQSANFILPRKAAYKLVEVQSSIGRRQLPAIYAQKSHVGDNAHWVYHCNDAPADFYPVPSKASIAVATEPAPDGMS